MIERLDAAMGHRLTLVSAPVGFGKTTLLADWAFGSGMPVAWLSVDQGDNNPARFMLYVVAALRRLEPGIGKNASALLSGGAGHEELILAALLSELEEIATISPSYSTTTTFWRRNSLTTRSPSC